MRHRVVITDPADRNFRDHFQWIKERSSQGADAWRSRIIEAVKSLEISPERHALARESAAFPVEIRCLLSGKNRSAFRILYQIKDNEVGVLAIRRPTQDLMDPEDESNPSTWQGTSRQNPASIENQKNTLFRSDTTGPFNVSRD